MAKKGVRATNLRKEVHCDERQSTVARLFLQGASLSEVARQLCISPSTASRDMMKAREAWKKETAKTYDELLPEKLAELDAIRAAAWEGWKRSIRPENTISNETSVGPDGETQRRGRKRKSTAGDDRFLARLESCLRLECQLRGLLDQDAGNTVSTVVNAVEIVINNAEEKEKFDKIYSLEEFQRQQKTA
ncbi:MAG: hypothetical protein ACF788_01300 [Novipirellula sp. JB048]